MNIKNLQSDEEVTENDSKAVQPTHPLDGLGAAHSDIGRSSRELGSDEAGLGKTGQDGLGIHA